MRSISSVDHPATTPSPEEALTSTSTPTRSAGPGSLPLADSEIQPRSARASSSDDASALVGPRHASPALRWRNAALKTLMPEQRARLRLTQLAARVPDLLAAERTACLRIAQEKFDTGELTLPRAFEGKVAHGSDGKLTSPDTAVAAILRYAQVKDPDAFHDLQIDGACTLGLPLEANVLLQAQLFAHGCAVRQLDLSDGSSAEADIDLSTYTTREAIKKGRDGFQPGAKLTHADPAEAEPGPRYPGEGEHPFEFLQKVRFRVESSSPALQHAVERCLNSDDPTTLELRGRLGALAVKSVFSQKEITKHTWIALGLSLAAAGGVAAALDIFAWGAVHNQLKNQFGEDDPRTKLADVLLASLTPAIAETMDSFVVGRLMEKMRGGSFMPESLSDAWDTLKNALKSGGVASIGSIGNNVSELTRKWAYQPLNFLANQVAVSTSGAMVPLEVDKAHDSMTAGVIQQMSNGFFPPPRVADAEGTSEAQQVKALAQQVKLATEPALDVAPGDGLAVNSMGIGALVSQLVFLPADALARTGKLKPVVKSIVSIITNTPTEIISTTIGSVTGRWLGLPGKKMTTDDEKDRLVMELIADKAIQRLNSPNADDPAASAEITEAELQAIEHPGLELTFKAGKAITNTMNGAVGLVSNVFGVLRGRPPQTLGETVDTTRLRTPGV